MADVLRRLIRLSVSTAPSAEETQRLTAQLAAVADELEQHAPEVPIPRFMAPDPDGPPKEVPLGGAMPYDPIVGPFNPLALPVVLEFDPPIARGVARSTSRTRVRPAACTARSSWRCSTSS